MFKGVRKIKHKIDLSSIDCLVLISQNTDVKIPHTLAVLHNKLNLSKITLVLMWNLDVVVSGYVYGLSIILSFI
ncbi:hypothetical protein BGG35_07185 [Campylobacter lari]|nr:hypothetical protein [Campylobacter lari]